MKDKTFRTESRRNLFTHGVVILWKPLLQRAVEAHSLFTFKTDISRFLGIRGSKGYEDREGNGSHTSDTILLSGKTG